jgi:hypothetical protein
MFGEMYNITIALDDGSKCRIYENKKIACCWNVDHIFSLDISISDFSVWIFSIVPN